VEETLESIVAVEIEVISSVVIGMEEAGTLEEILILDDVLKMKVDLMEQEVVEVEVEDSKEMIEVVIMEIVMVDLENKGIRVVVIEDLSNATNVRE
jgi:hypothetical protein